VYYLAYGSNMAAARLQQRIPSARRLGVVRLPGHRLTFDNYSTKDGSGKCDALCTGGPNDLVFAVLYRIDPDAKPILDGYEGLGVEYRDAFLEVEAPDGRRVDALIYYATNLKSGLRPYHWYQQHVLYGARENQLPEDYVADIERVVSILDPDQERAEREIGIYLGNQW